MLVDNVPASFVVNWKLGVVSFDGVVIGVTCSKVGAVVSITKSGNIKLPALPDASVTVIVFPD